MLNKKLTIASAVLIFISNYLTSDKTEFNYNLTQNLFLGQRVGHLYLGVHFHRFLLAQQVSFFLGSGCGSVGGAVASDTRETRFESSNRRNFIMNMLTVEKMKRKKKRGRERRIFKEIISSYLYTYLSMNHGVRTRCTYILIQELM